MTNSQEAYIDALKTAVSVEIIEKKYSCTICDEKEGILHVQVPLGSYHFLAFPVCKACLNKYSNKERVTP